MPDMRRLVEVGCWKGDSISYLAAQIKLTGRPFVLWGVDIWKDPAIYTIYNHTLAEAGVRDAVLDITLPSLAACEQFTDGSLDFVFLDASHRPQDVLDDARAWQRKVRAGGILAGHDYCESVSGNPSDSDYENVALAVKAAKAEGVIGDYTVLPNTVWMARV